MRLSDIKPGGWFMYAGEEFLRVQNEGLYHRDDQQRPVKVNAVRVNDGLLLGMDPDLLVSASRRGR